jgi:presequence protease
VIAHSEAAHYIRISMFKKGEHYKGFLIKKVIPIEELQATLIELEHLTSGAMVMHIGNNDPENLFCLSFQTFPYNSNGIAHILEHTVLCGSKKFPVKDPFFSMTRRSLNTFMNALTGSDFTCYPAASQVKKDFYNLLDVYLDSVFHPLLKKESFLQEGHRLELIDPNDIESPLEFKGIVYNEMKGAMNSADSRLWQGIMTALTPDLTYSHNSGGDPFTIPTLTYEDLLQFHKTYYHPSKCLFFFYGNFPLEQHLDFIEEKALSTTTKTPKLLPQPKQKRFSSPKTAIGYYPVTEKDFENKTMVGWAWLTVPIQDQETLLALTLLDIALMETDGSLLKLPLLQSNLCTSANGFLDTDMSEIPFIIVCKGCKEENIEALDQIVFQSLQKIWEQKIPDAIIESALHQLEFSRMEITGDHAPFGLTLFMRSALTKQHGCRPEGALLVHTLFEELRLKLQDPNYLPNILKKHLIDNPHRVRFTLHPNTELAKKELAREKETLASIQKTLSEKEKQSLIQQMKDLSIYQKTVEKQSLECLPKVTLEDVPLHVRNFPLKQKNNVLFHPCFTNYILYADLIYDLHCIKEEDLPYAQFLISILPELGAGKRDYIQNLEYMQSHIGSLSLALAMYPQTENPSQCNPALILRGKALYRNAPQLFSIFKELLLHARLDETKRIEELLLQIHTALQQKLPQRALRYASQLSLSGFSHTARINEQWRGLSYIKWIQSMIEAPNKLFPTLEKLKQKLLSLSNPKLIVTCDEKIYNQLEKENFFEILTLKQDFLEKDPWNFEAPLTPFPSQGKIISSPVAFTCKSFQVASYLHPHASALTVATHLLESKVLFPKIRERGGAYGCGASYTPIEGTFSLYAYRDPRIASTLTTFDDAIATIANGCFSPTDVESAKLETIQHFDAPVSPGSRGLIGYNWSREGKTTTRRQQFRDKILNLSAEAIALAVKQELLEKEGVVVTFAGQELLEKENKKLKKKLPLFSV